MHYEALKQSAFDPRDGTINVDILATGVSSSARRQQKELAAVIKKHLEAKGKITTIKYHQLFEEMKQSSDLVGDTLFEVFFITTLLLNKFCFAGHSCFNDEL